MYLHKKKAPLTFRHEGLFSFSGGDSGGVIAGVE